MYKKFIHQCMILSLLSSVTSFASAATWQDVGTLSSGNFPSVNWVVYQKVC